jgi:UDP-N-acetylglucosamine 2-epimerase
MGIIITESDKKRILSLIKESIDTTELINYANEYIDGNNCDQIYNDLLTYQTAVNNGEVVLNQTDKNTLSDRDIQV